MLELRVNAVHSKRNHSGPTDSGHPDLDQKTKKQMMNPKNGLNLDPYSPPPWEIRLAPFFSENLCLFYVRHINFKRLTLLRCKFSHHFHFSEFCWESNFSFIQSSHFHFHFSLSKTQILARNYHLLRNSLP